MFSIIVFFTTTGVVKQCMNVIMEAVPEDINIDEIKKDFMTIHGVEAVNDLHVWELTAGKMVLTCHIVTSSPETALATAIARTKKYGFGHVTI